jgi:hypothetical protein
MTKTNAKGGASGRASMAGGSSSTRAKRRRRSRHRESTIVIIDRLLANNVSITINGETKRLPVAEAIVLQLLQKAMAGSARAWRALMKYRDFASRRSEKTVAFSFVDSNYTTAFANSLQEDENG